MHIRCLFDWYTRLIGITHVLFEINAQLVVELRKTKIPKNIKNSKKYSQNRERITKQPPNFEKFSGSMMFGVLCDYSNMF